MIAISTVRTRRAAANTTLLGILVSLAATLLVGWGLARRTAPFVASYVYLNSSVAFSGPQNFQSFEIDIVLRVDHLTVVAIALIDLCVGLVLAWNRVMGRNETGPARFNAVISIFLFGAFGTLMSSDLAEMFTFWALCGGASRPDLFDLPDEPKLGAPGADPQQHGIHPRQPDRPGAVARQQRGQVLVDQAH